MGPGAAETVEDLSRAIGGASHWQIERLTSGKLRKILFDRRMMRSRRCKLAINCLRPLGVAVLAQESRISVGKSECPLLGFISGGQSPPRFDRIAEHVLDQTGVVVAERRER